MAEIENLDFNPQNYNLQNHCGLYNIDNPLIYKNIIETSLNTGINVIGFNEVAPDTEYEIPIDKMYPTQLENYINEISNLRKTYKNRAEILCGLTVTNFEPQKLSHYISLKNKIDFLALDIKSNDSNEKNINYPLIYAEQVTKAMDTGLFDYVMHPDSFMAYIDNIAPIDKDEYQKNSKKAIDKICNKAKELNIPLEFDYTNLVNVNQNDYESLKIPSKEFWTRAVEFKNPVIGGINTTDLNNIYYLRTLENNRENYIPDLKTEQSYIPSIYKDTTLPYEYYLTISVLNNIQKAFKNTKELPASQVLIEGITPYYNYYNTLIDKMSSIHSQGEENIIREKNLKMQSLIYEALLTATEKYKCTTFEQFEYVVPRLVVLKLSKINKIVKNKMSYDLMEYVNNLAIPNPENNSEKKEIEEPKKKQRKNNKGSSDFVLIVATIGITLVILVTITIIVFALAK